MIVKRNIIILLMGLTWIMPMQASNHIDWTKVINAIVQVESRGNVQAVNGKSVGPMQITPIFVEECNRILSMKNSKKRYTLSDRIDLQKSKEMFLLFQEKYNPTNNIEWAIRAWNGGIRFKNASTNSYYKKVMAAMR